MVKSVRTMQWTARMLLTRLCFAIAIAACAAWTCPATALKEPDRSQQVLDLNEAPSAEEIAAAKERLRQGDIVRLTGKALGSVSLIGGIVLSTTRAASASGPTRGIPGRAVPASATPLVVRVIGLHETGDGVIHQFEQFASSHQSDSDIRSSAAFARWVEDQQTRSGKLADPSSPGEAWTPLFNVSLVATTDDGNELQSTVYVYRLVETDDVHDWYMVLTNPSLQPHYQGCVFGFAPDYYCGWYNQSRSIQISLSGGSLIDHGPTGTITSSTAGFSIGGTLMPTGPGFSAAYSQTWTQPAVTTTDASNATVATWNEAFTGPELPFFDPAPPPTSTGGFLSHQGAIFSTPEGTTSISIPVQISAQWAFNGTQNGLDTTFFDTLELSTAINTGPPQFSVIPSSLSIAAGGTATVRVTALIPNSTAGFTWTIATNHPLSWLTVPSPGPFSESRDIPVSVAPGTPDGSTGTLTIDTVPAFAAPSVEGGPLLVNVTVGTPSPPLLPPAGVLLAGGLLSGSTINNRAAVYDVSTQQIVPVANMTTPRFSHSATLLADGDILIAGGCTEFLPNNEGCFATATAEIYHPATSTFTAVGSMASARTGALAVRLSDDRVLIVGGDNILGVPLDSAEIYNPATRTFTATGNPQQSHRFGGATALSATGKSSQAIVYGGLNAGTGFSTWELWDSAAGSNGGFILIGTMATGQAAFPAPAPWVDGRLVIVGGDSENAASQVTTEQLLAAGSQTFSLGFPLNQARVDHTLTALASPPGLLVTGGTNPSGALATAELRSAGGWNVLSGNAPCPGSAGCMTTARVMHSATLLPDGRVFIAGGGDSSGTVLGTTEFYDPVSKTFQVGPLMRPAAGMTATAFSLTDVPTTITVISDVNPSAWGQQVTFTATVSPSSASGQVTFSEGGNTLKSVPLKSGQAVFQTTALAPGQHTIIAAYGGDQTFQGSNASVVQSVTQLASSTTLTGPASAFVGSKVTYTALVSPQGAAGQVAFYDNGAQLAVVNLAPNNQAVYATASFALGIHSITAKYLGNADYQPSDSGAVQLNVSRTTSSTKLTSAPNPSTYQQPVTLTATVTSPSGTPEGQVNFLDGATTIGSAALSGGKAALTLSTLSPGSHALTAVYQGSSNFGASTSLSIQQTVKPAATSTALTSSINPSTFGQSVILTATVAPAPGSGTPTGTVTFKDGTATLGVATLSNGAGSFSTAALGGGSHAITAVYGGDGNYAGSTSPVLTQTVNRASASVAVSSALNPSFYGQSVTFTAQVSANAGAPTGTVTFKDGSATLGTAILSNGQASLSTSTLTGGTHAVTAVYGGDTNFLPSTSSPLLQNVNKSGTTIAVSSSINPSNTGQTVIFTAAVTPQSGTNPAGIVTFFDGPTVLGASSVSAGLAAFATSSLSAGSHVITATYGGDGNYLGSTSPGLTQIVNRVIVAPSFTNLTASQAITFGKNNIDLSGTIAAPGPTYPPANEKVKVTIGSVSQQVNIGGKGAFFFNNFPTSTLAAGSYAITYDYPGDSSFANASDSSTTLTVIKASPIFLNPTNSQTVQQGTASINLSGTIAAGSLSPPAGESISITINGAIASTQIGTNGAFSTTFDTHAIPASTTPYPITYGYAGDSNFNPATNSATTVTVSRGGALPTTTTLAPSVQVCLSGQDFILTITVALVPPAGPPDGEVVLTRNNPDGTVTSLGQQFLINGIWAPAFNGMAPGKYTFLAHYQGTPQFQPSDGQVNLTCRAP